MFKRALAASALVGFALAQNPQGLSDKCTGALLGIAANPDASACLSPAPLIGIFANPSNTSIVGPINSWLTSLCASQSCSDATLAAIVTNATAGCTAELSVLGYTADANNAIIAAVQKYYPTVRKLVCLTDNGQNCVTETLKDFETIVGPLSVDNIVKVVAAGLNFGNIPKNMTCTNCTKAAYNVLKQDLPDVFADNETTAGLQEQCGASFTDGTTPSGIFQSAASASDTQGKTQGKSNGFITAPLIGGTALAVISSLFAVLA